MQCPVFERCSGCDWIGKPYQTQIDDKIAELRRHWEASGLPAADIDSFHVRSPGEGGLRDRVDLVLRNGKLGLYEKGKKEIVELGDCPQMSGALRSWYRDFREELPPVSLGSVRLRVSPTGKRGAWLDFSNNDIKRLLDERAYLKGLEAKAIVEIGQKRKRIRRKESSLGLGEPELEPWFETYLAEKPQPLYSAIGTFSQVGFRANQFLVRAFQNVLPASVTGQWLELGCGIGNFTLPLAHAGARVTALEIDALTVSAAKRSAEEAKLVDRIDVKALGFHVSTPAIKDLLKNLEGVVADPPRSGLQIFPKLLEELPAAEKPKVFIYVSCFMESFAADSARLYELGYRLKAAEGVDQFTQSPHLEVLARFELS